MPFTHYSRNSPSMSSTQCQSIKKQNFFRNCLLSCCLVHICTGLNNQFTITITPFKFSADFQRQSQQRASQLFISRALLQNGACLDWRASAKYPTICLFNLLIIMAVSWRPPYCTPTGYGKLGRLLTYKHLLARYLLHPSTSSFQTSRREVRI